MSNENLMDLVTKEDMPMMTKAEMRKTHENQHMQSKKITGKSKKKSKK